jgi:ABC-type Na+ efflux pump permease subunit
MREWNAFWLPFLYVGTLSFVFGALYAGQRAMEVPPWQAGRQLFATISFASLALLGLAVPALSAGSITVEREQRTLSSLLLTCLAARSIVTGKLLATAAYALLLLATSLPVVVTAAAIGGVSPAVVLLHYLSLGATATMLAAFGVFVSAWFQRSAYAIALCYGALALLLGLTLFVVATLAQVELALEMPLLRHAAFVGPLYFLEERTRWQWPLALFWSIGVAAVLRESAVARLERETRGVGNGG